MSQTIFGSETPAVPDANDGDPLALATYFSPGVDGVATHARWRFPNTLPSAPVPFGLYRLSDGVKIGSGTFSAPVAGAWNQQAYVEGPVALTAGDSYAVAIWTPGAYVATGGYFNTGKVSGDLTCQVAAGRFVGSPGLVLPEGQFNGGCYFVDLVFETGEAPPEEHDTTGTAPAAVTAAGVTTSARSHARTGALSIGATGTDGSSRFTSGAASTQARASASTSTARPVAVRAPLSATARASVSTSRATTGRAAVSVSAGAYSVTAGAGPRIVTATRAARQIVTGVRARIVTTTTRA
jgi:hypothetical protein